ncbi:hypothetical protein SPBR_03741 [Sporothrix brasiliensis 5110]|uniref:F-box domain-containing protein n=1 Tax=Sporothrix brasiliensis 5110 TaxID=1398154 RepID=A0A0C2J0C1_9PEZI|nr:uncharacterized protein SPBR_03741 [Sporothrix brasiliensis 5110]KIH94811.1 hypothetical protein SPBR_03741 [Sporothrix brasiliensis 5110]
MSSSKVQTGSNALDNDDGDAVPLYTENDKVGILNLTAAANTDVDLKNRAQCPIDEPLVLTLTKPFRRKPAADLGGLSGLPLELVFAICRELDVKSCLALRQVNRRAREIVTGSTEYVAVVTHALGVVQAVLWSGMGTRVTFPDLHRLLCTHECMICSVPDGWDSYRFYDSRAPMQRPLLAPGIKSMEVGQAALEQAIMNRPPSAIDTKIASTDKTEPVDAAPPVHKKPTALTAMRMAQTNDQHADHIKAHEMAAGLYLFLPTLTRCCKSCLEESPRVRVVPVVKLRTAFDLPRRYFLPYVITPWLSKNKMLAPPALEFRARRTSPRPGSDGYKMKVGMVTREAALQILFEAGFSASRAEEMIYISGYQDEFSWWSELKEREKYTVMMPFLDRHTNAADGGYTCRGCDAAIQKLYGHLKVNLVYMNTVFATEAAFFKHFAACPDAIEMWKTQSEA